MKLRGTVSRRGSVIYFQLLATVLLAGLLSAGVQYVTLGPGCQQLVVASSQEKYTLLLELAAAFNQTNPHPAGRCVSVQVEEVFSGQAETYLQKGWPARSGQRPDVWSPASRAWVELLRQAPAEAGLVPPDQEIHTLFKTPLVIGMPQPMATALGYPIRPVGWSDVFALATQSRGWASKGHPEWGQFKLGKTTPVISTSGLLALVGTYDAAARGAPLTPATLADPAIQSFAAAIESSVVHYGGTAGDFLRALQFADDQSTEATLDYVSAIVLQEKELLDYNAGIVSGAPSHNPARVPLVPVYPREGTFVADHPYVLLNWSPAQERPDILKFKHVAANAFFDFLAQDTKSAAAIDSARFRGPGEAYAAGSIGQPVRAGLEDLGTPPYTQPLLELAQPLRASSLPLGPTLVAEINSWTRLRRPTHVAILIDVVNYNRTRGPHLALPQDLQPRDAVGLWTFPPARPSGPFSVASPVASATREHLDTITAQLLHLRSQPPGSISLYDAVTAAVTEMTASYDPSAINAVLVIDLSPTISGSPTQLERFLENQPDARVVRVFTVGAAEHPLRDIASAGHGAYYSQASVDSFLTDAAAHL